MIKIDASLSADIIHVNTKSNFNHTGPLGATVTNVSNSHKLHTFQKEKGSPINSIDLIGQESISVWQQVGDYSMHSPFPFPAKGALLRVSTA